MVLVEKLLCKNAYILTINGDETYILYNGKEYTIFFERSGFCSIISEYKGMSVHFNSINKNVLELYLWYYFYTPEEIRKMKLESL